MASPLLARPARVAARTLVRWQSKAADAAPAATSSAAPQKIAPAAEQERQGKVGASTQLELERIALRGAKQPPAGAVRRMPDVTV